MTRRRLPLERLVPRYWQFDPGLLLALLIALLAAMPFLTRPGLPRGTDAELHVFRAAELGYSLRAGDLYPRWAPDFYYGYGYPIFNFYAPMTYYLANLFDLLPGIDIVSAVKLVFILALVSASVGTYLFVRDWIGPRAGLLAAALYVLSPYVFFVDPHMRGVLAESFSLGLFPLALWAYSRLLVDGRRRWLVLGAILVAALIMSHNLLGLVFAVILLVFLAWELTGQVAAMQRQATLRLALAQSLPMFSRVALALVLGAGLSAIFWLPMVLEQGDVKLNLTGPGHFDFHNHFLTLSDLLGATPVLDLRATAPNFAYNLGLPQWPLALLGLVALLWGQKRFRRSTGFFVVCSVGLVVMMLAVSTSVWETVPGMVFLQFPWRLLGPAAATLSMTAAAGYLFIAHAGSKGGGSVARSRWGAAILGLAIGFTLWLALPAMFPPLWDADFGPTDPAAMIDFELTGIAVGTTSTGDYLPATVEIKPHPEPDFLETYTAPGGVDKVNRASLKEGTVVETVSRGPTHDRMRVESDKPFVLRLFTFYFPGWRATIDGREVPIELGRPEGFITVRVPSGIHEVEVRLHMLATPGRAMGAFISLFALVGLVLAGWWRRGPTRTLSTASTLEKNHHGSASPLQLDRTAGMVVGAVLLAFFVFKVGVVDRQHSWFRRTSPPDQVLGAAYSLSGEGIEFGRSIQLLGYDISSASVSAGGKLPLTLYWRATAPVSDNYQVFAHLTRPATHLWGQSDKLNPGEVPTTRWPLDKYVRDEHELDILPGTPPGEYELTIGLYSMDNGVRMPVFNGEGNSLGDTLTLPTTVRVGPPRRPPEEASLGLTDQLGVQRDGQVELLGAVLPDRRIELPGFIHLALLWRSEVDGPDDITVRVLLVDSDGEVIDEIVTRPVDGRYPSPGWTAGEVVRDQYSFWLAEGFAPGPYELRVGLVGDEGWDSLGWVEVVGP